VLVVARVGIRRPPRRLTPPRAAHPHPAVPDIPGDVRQIRIVEDRVPHLMSEGSSYRLAPVTYVSTVREAAAPEVNADLVVLDGDGGRVVWRVPVVRVREGLPREFTLNAVHKLRHVRAKVEGRWVIIDVRTRAARPRFIG
jgi:hypothetical protein